MKLLTQFLLILFSINLCAQEITKLQLDQIIFTDGIFVEKDGTIYATEGWDGDKIYEVNPNGKIKVFASGLKGPIDIAKGKDGFFYVSEWKGAQLSKIDPKGNVNHFATVKPGPGPMTQDALGNLYVTHNVNDGKGNISKITLDGQVEIFSEDDKLINPGGIDFDSNGNLYVSNFNNANIVKINPSGKSSILATVPGDKQWRTGHLKIIDDTIYITALMDHRIYRVSLAGKVETLAGTGEQGQGVGNALSTKLANPNGLFFNEESNELYFTEAFAKTGFIQKIKLPDNQNTFRSAYYAGIAFRETPYANILGTRPLPKEKAEKVNHFQFDYDKEGKLVRVRHLLNGKIKPFSDRFVRGSHIEITYQGNQEIRTFYNEHGQRCVVSGDVYKSIFTTDDNGDRTSLKFYGVDGNPIENDFRIASYEWKTNLDGTVVEKRFDIDGNIQRNRPGFGYYITKFTYDHRGLLRLMTNLGKEGKEITPDDAGIAHTKIGYDNNAFFVQWLNLDKNGKPKRGMSNIAEIKYTPAPLYEHESATFVDADGKPQTTNWGAHIVKYTFDNYGNATSRSFYGIDGKPVNANNGVGLIKTTYTADGMHQVNRAYFTMNNVPTHINGTEIHEVRTDFNTNNKPVSRSFYNLSDSMVNDSSLGYATEKWIYDSQGRLIERQFLDIQGKMADHSTWGIARMVYTYLNDTELKSVDYYKANGSKDQAVWNPRH
ncbi:hypothetical protein [Flagellimonas nanhaiensis]|uniref:SMP-30/Gluconolactonase/LRE-like region domain-containing protein n=1 Tax=Flagellimonas nanhaiensis TaxID=2292706 RepID=A0A371JLA1_9FLAO|nr:hypothetical protein [Allomuricauda nanhaiensis]RDY57744.1 hypothetical protein DX873_17755 [Allomuricauda nanhaiensis]